MLHLHYFWRNCPVILYIFPTAQSPAHLLPKLHTQQYSFFNFHHLVHGCTFAIFRFMVSEAILHTNSRCCLATFTPTITLQSHIYFKYCLLALVACVSGHVASRTSDLHDGISWVAVTASLRDIWVSLMIWSAQRSGGRPLGRRHDEGEMEARMSMAWVPVSRFARVSGLRV